MKELLYKRGHQLDMHFAVERQGNGNYVICKIFYRINPCLKYIKAHNEARNVE